MGAVSTCGEGSSVPTDLFSDVRGGGQDLLSAVLEDDHLTIDVLVVAPGWLVKGPMRPKARVLDQTGVLSSFHHSRDHTSPTISTSLEYWTRPASCPAQLGEMVGEV